MHASGDANYKRWQRATFLALITTWLLARALMADGDVLPTTSAARTKPKSYVVTIAGLQFNPSPLTVHRGDTIVWVNKDLFPHTVTAAAQAFDSGDIAPNASWTYRARKSGDYAYSCAYHPTMKGQLSIR